MTIFLSEINCGDPGPLPNGRVEMTEKGTAQGATAYFRCFSNTTLRGDNKTYCQSNGKWSKPRPQCLGIVNFI